MAISRPTTMPIPFADGGGRNAIPTAASGTPGAASLIEGFPAVTRTPLVAGGVPPSGLDMNGILNLLSQHIVFMGGGGQYRYDADLVASQGGYPIGTVLQSNDGLSAYVNVAALNTVNFNTTPSSIGSTWIPWSGAAARPHTTTVLTGSGTWIAPYEGWFLVRGFAGGGGSGGVGSTGGLGSGGGGGGGRFERWFYATKGQAFAYSVGAGGGAAGAGGAGGAGGSTTFGGMCTATPGQGGGSNGTGNGGAGGSATGGDTNYTGSSGGQSTTASGGTSGGAPGGGPGIGASSGGPQVGAFPGGGANGRAPNATGAGSTGAAGTIEIIG